MNWPSAFWKLFCNRAQSGSAMMSSSHPTSKMTPSRISHSSREMRTTAVTGARCGMVVTDTALPLREHAQRFRRQRHGKRLALGDGEIAHQVEREVGQDRDV